VLSLMSTSTDCALCIAPCASSPLPDALMCMNSCLHQNENRCDGPTEVAHIQTLITRATLHNRSSLLDMMEQVSSFCARPLPYPRKTLERDGGVTDSEVPSLISLIQHRVRGPGPGPGPGGHSGPALGGGLVPSRTIMMARMARGRCAHHASLGDKSRVLA